MTQIQRNLISSPAANSPADGPSFHAVVSAAFHGVRRNVRLIAAITLAFVALSVFTILRSTPIYTASTTIYIDPRQSNAFQENGAILLNSDALLVDTEIEILRSPTLARRVVAELGLAEVLPEDETTEPGGLLAWLGQMFQGETATGILSVEDAAIRRAAAGLLNNSSVARRESTYVIEITVNNADKVLAADIANTYADQYLNSQLDINSDRLERLSGRSVTALSAALATMQEAAEQVNQFRLDNGIESEGRQVFEAELFEVNKSLINMRQRRFDDELQLQRVTRVLDIGDMSSTIEINVASEKVASLRTKILEIEIELVRLNAVGTGNSPQIAPKQDELAAIKTELKNEYGRIKSQLASKIEFSIQEEQLLGQRVAQLRQDVAAVANNEVQLRELEMRADSERAVYQILLGRFYETSEELTFQTNAARVLTAAVVPAGPSAPSKLKIMLLGIVGGLFAGLAAAFLREQLTDGLREPSQIEALGIQFLGAAPLISSSWPKFNWLARTQLNNIRWPQLSGNRHEQQVAKLNYAVDYPMSQYSETIRSIVFAAASKPQKANGGRVFAVTSIYANEGKTTIAANLAAYYAEQGKRVRLIDFDLRNPTLSRLFADEEAATAETVSGTKSGDATAGTGSTGSRNYRFSGLIADMTASDLIQLVDPHAISALMEESRKNYDIVIVDTAPLTFSSDARIGANLADNVVLAVRWGKTSAEQIGQVLARNPHLDRQSIGAVFNMGSVSEINRFSGIRTTFETRQKVA